MVLLIPTLNPSRSAIRLVLLFLAILCTTLTTASRAFAADLPDGCQLSGTIESFQETLGDTDTDVSLNTEGTCRGTFGTSYGETPAQLTAVERMHIVACQAPSSLDAQLTLPAYSESIPVTLQIPVPYAAWVPFTVTGRGAGPLVVSNSAGQQALGSYSMQDGQAWCDSARTSAQPVTLTFGRVSPTPSGGPGDPVVNAQLVFHRAFLDATGFSLVAEECTANPFASDCPPVDSIVYQTSDGADAADDMPTSYAMTADGEEEPDQTSTPYTATSPDSHTPGAGGAGFICEVTAGTPQRIWAGLALEMMQGRVWNECEYNRKRPVRRQEVYGSLQLLDGSKWRTMASASARGNGAGRIITPYAQYDCVHLAQRVYRMRALGYSVIRRTGYTGVDVGKHVSTDCL